MATLTFDGQLEPSEFPLVAELHREWATLDGYDVQAIDRRLPTDDQMATDLSGADVVVVARDGELIMGYGRVVSWTETDGTRVHLLDTHSSPGPDRAAADEGLLAYLEERVGRDHLHRGTVLAANADVADLDRTAVLNGLGYALHFEMVELELRDRLIRGPIPSAVSVRSAQPADAGAITRLIEDSWAGRPHFGGFSVERSAAWLERSDPELFLLAEAADDLVGIAVADVSDRVVEIDDLGVHPSWRRRGLATGLMSELLDLITTRSTLPVRLLTEGHDPSGARTLYERLGFTTAACHGRYRKPMP